MAGFTPSMKLRFMVIDGVCSCGTWVACDLDRRGKTCSLVRPSAVVCCFTEQRAYKRVTGWGMCNTALYRQWKHPAGSQH